MTIVDPDRPMGTHVFTAMERRSATDMRWSVVTLNDGREQHVPEPHGRKRVDHDQHVESASNDIGAAKAALDRIVIPQEALERMASLDSARSSLIISDEGLSFETGKGTDFIVLLSGEPQGGLKIRRRAPALGRYIYPFDGRSWRRAPFGGSYYAW